MSTPGGDAADLSPATSTAPTLAPRAPVDEGWQGQLLPGGPVTPPAGAGPGGIAFRVEPEQAEKLATALDVAADLVEGLISRAEQLSSVTPGASDMVSLSAAGEIALWPNSGDGALMPALTGYRDQLRGSAAAYRQQLSDYRRNEELTEGDINAVDAEGQS